MDYIETYEDAREMTDDIFTLMKKLQSVAGKKEIFIEIDWKKMEIAVYDDSDSD